MMMMNLLITLSFFDLSLSQKIVQQLLQPLFFFGFFMGGFFLGNSSSWFVLGYVGLLLIIDYFMADSSTSIFGFFSSISSIIRSCLGLGILSFFSSYSFYYFSIFLSKMSGSSNSPWPLILCFDLEITGLIDSNLSKSSGFLTSDCD